MRHFVLRVDERHYDLEVGDYLIGRSSSCNICLDDPMTSRQHAALGVRADQVVLHDLQSRNGVCVNGRQIQGPAILAHSDRITIGGQDLFLYERSRLHREKLPTLNDLARLGVHQTISEAGIPVPLEQREGGDTDDETVTEARSVLDTLLSESDRRLSQDRLEEAQPFVRQAFTLLHLGWQKGRGMDDQGMRQASRFALLLAERTGKTEWIDRVFELYAIGSRLLPPETLDSIERLLLAADDYSPRVLGEYAETMEAAAGSLAEADRPALERLRQLARKLAP